MQNLTLDNLEKSLLLTAIELYIAELEKNESDYKNPQLADLEVLKLKLFQL